MTPVLSRVTGGGTRLRGTVAVVAGATRGCGRGIAVELGAEGAKVYCVGRSVRGQRSPVDRPETIEETAEKVTVAGGIGIPVRADCTAEEEMLELFERVGAENDGRLDVLVNDVWGGEKLIEWGVPVWESRIAQGLLLQRQAVHSHLLLQRYGVPLLVARKKGVVFEVTDGDGYHFRGNALYDLAKVSVIRLAQNLHEELKVRGIPVTSLAISPGYLRSEEMLATKGVTADTWREAAKTDGAFAHSETPHLIGRCVVALLLDPKLHERSGQALATWNLTGPYGVKDIMPNGLTDAESTV